MIAVRPPEYFPSLPYMALAGAVECFVLADTFQYSRQSFQNRCRLRTPQGWQWISIPLVGGQHGLPIGSVQIDGGEPWARKHGRSFEYNYRTTPFFDYYAGDFQALLLQRWASLGELTCATVELLHRLLELPSRIIRASSLEGCPSSLPHVLAALGDPAVLAPEGTAEHDRAQAPSVKVFRYETPVYRQNFGRFIPGMSAVDLLFNHGPEASAVLRKGAVPC